MLHCQNGISGGTLTLYVLLTNLTDEGRKTIKQRPDRIREVNQEIEAMGVTVTAQYSVLGPYDFVNIVEAPMSESGPPRIRVDA